MMFPSIYLVKETYYKSKNCNTQKRFKLQRGIAREKQGHTFIHLKLHIPVLHYKLNKLYSTLHIKEMINKCTIFTSTSQNLFSGTSYLQAKELLGFSKILDSKLFMYVLLNLSNLEKRFQKM